MRRVRRVVLDRATDPVRAKTDKDEAPALDPAAYVVGGWLAPALEGNSLSYDHITLKRALEQDGAGIDAGLRQPRTGLHIADRHPVADDIEAHPRTIVREVWGTLGERTSGGGDIERRCENALIHRRGPGFCRSPWDWSGGWAASSRLCVRRLSNPLERAS